jgi:antitoxin component YwqK of YwqJK toxin-antitoxin module
MHRPLFPSAVLLALLVSTPQAEELRELHEDGSPKIVREVKHNEAGEPINHGVFRRFHVNGKLAASGRCEEGERAGEWSFFRESGRKRETGAFEKGRRHGLWQAFEGNGAPESKGRYEEGRRAGEWVFWRDGERETAHYRWIALEYEDGARRAEGNSLRSSDQTDTGKTGPWIYWWPDGGVMAECRYDRGVLQGEVWFRYPDGTLEPEMITGRYRDGRRIRPLDPALLAEEATSGGPGGETARQAFPFSRRADLFLTEWIEGTPDRAELARAELVRLGRESFPGILNRLRGADLATEPGASLAFAMHRILGEICGGFTYPWAEGSTEEALHTRRLTVQRWRAFWLANATVDARWEIDLRLGKRWADFTVHDSILFQLPLPEELAAGQITDGAGDRERGDRRARRRLAHGGAGTDRALESALHWLVLHQEADGRWDSDRHDGHPLFDVGVTSQALLALMGGGWRPAGGEDRGSIVRGVLWLIERQDPTTGRIISTRRQDRGNRDAIEANPEANPESIHEHCLATGALAEAAFLTDSPALRHATGIAVMHLIASRNAEERWEFGEGSVHGDSSITISILLPLLHAVEAGVSVPPEVYSAIASWLDEITDERSGRSRVPAVERLDPGAPRFAPDRGDDVTASVLLARLFFQQPRDSVVVKRQTRQLLRRGPRWRPGEAEFDLYRLRDSTYALFQVGGDSWHEWNDKMKPLLLDAQCKSGVDRGSWDPIGRFGESGGRVLSTALMAQTLEVYDRYPVLQ